ncbi:hypothetical protein EYC98_11010 [Halieaceae bacterium IMCC14734]|uniref:Glycerol kinase n=1 Tax=Candidatus Litorirhabdus singularis TaxID=2518993 RepID=A0ABT3TGH5_9GAMM|nr:hypothetical protein [Candidatus Litorirhabdus singularis]MCX2981393.1 hypothetical protein [Candidatus Litorirhabdus singularis]
MSEDPDKKISTTGMAKVLDLSVQQLFATLKDYGWIRRVDDAWVLTPKGEFEGGEYVESHRYGRYIVWPPTLDKHPLLAALESNQRITASEMQRYYTRLHPRQINRSLAELGLQMHSILGWELTARGKQLGGQQQESAESGAYYVTWPHDFVDHPVIHRELIKQSDAGLVIEADGAGDDLFSKVESTPSEGLDGHLLVTPLELQVCNWLYLAQLTHACHRALPVEEEYYADFYLPSAHVYIECWLQQESKERLTMKLKKQALYQQHQLRLIDVREEDCERLDETLGRALLEFGIKV